MMDFQDFIDNLSDEEIPVEEDIEIEEIPYVDIDIVMLDFDLTISRVHTCKSPYLGKYNKNIKVTDIIQDPEFIIDFINFFRSKNIPVYIVSFGNQDFIINIMNKLFDEYADQFKSPYNQSPFDIENVYGNNCASYSTFSDICDQEIKPIYCQYARHDQKGYTLQNQYLKLKMIIDILNKTNQTNDVKVVLFDDTSDNVKILTNQSIRQKYENLSGIQVSQNLNRNYFCNVLKPNWSTELCRRYRSSPLTGRRKNDN